MLTLFTLFLVLTLLPCATVLAGALPFERFLTLSGHNGSHSVTPSDHTRYIRLRSAAESDRSRARPPPTSH